MSAGRFAPRNDGDIVELVTRNPLAWIFLRDAIGPFVTAAPLRPAAPGERLEKLVGHVPRRARIAQCLASPQEGLVLVVGPHGYVSPSWMSDRTQAPTWNFTSAQFVAEMGLVDDPAFLEAHLRDLVSATERGRDHAWRIDEMGPRLQKLANRIVAFEARIISTESRFKLGQDESDETFREIAEALGREGPADLLGWMKTFNPNR